MKCRGRWSGGRPAVLTVRLLIGAFIPRTQRGGETSQRDQRRRKENVQKVPGCCGNVQGVIAANKSGKDGVETQLY